MSQFMKALHGLVLEGSQETLNNDSKNATGITSPRPSIKEEPKIGEQSVISLKQRDMWMGTKLFLLQESGQGRLGWQTPKPTTTENSTPA